MISIKKIKSYFKYFDKQHTFIHKNKYIIKYLDSYNFLLNFISILNPYDSGLILVT